MLKAWKALALAVAAVLCSAPMAMAAEPVGEWEMVNPSGEIERFAIPPAARIDSLEGKTVVLRWNGKHNGDLFLDRVGELLTQQVPGITIHKAYELDPSINMISGNVNRSKEITDFIVSLKPDLVISSTAD